MARKDPHIKFHDLPDNILPCPFCGPVCPSTAVLMIEERIIHSQVAFAIDCTNCGCTTQNGAKGVMEPSTHLRKKRNDNNRL